MEQLESRAFQRAALKSESYRILGLLGLLGALMLYAIARGLAALQFRLLLAETLLLTLAICYEALMLRVVKGALQRERDVTRVIWVLNVLLETQIPTIALFLLIKSGLMSPYHVLVAPAMLIYFFFIILSTLRLSPLLSSLTGLAAALGYLAITFYTVMRYPSSEANLIVLFPPTLYFIYASLLLAGGIVAAFVARQIRVHVAAALHEAELKGELERVNHDLDIARSIQQGLLPARSLQLDNFEIAGWNKPADQTGGDYFDWQALADGRFAISLADATGHGIGPALVSTSCRAYARASFLAGGEQDELLSHLNRLLAEDLSANKFITFAAVFLDPSNSHVKVLSAGHGPILWYSYATDKIERLDAQGIPLGMIAGIEYEHGTEGYLGAGDILALVTDGFYEWENPAGEEFGVNRLEEVLRESRNFSAEEVIANLRSSVASFCQGTKQMDDLTAVILKRKAGPFSTRESADLEQTFSNTLPARKQQEIPLPYSGSHLLASE
jgi:serine phosphatase RsbU (regulator of sigma subunit)